MTDRLAEIEAAASAGHHPWWDTGQAPWDLHNLVEAVKAARLIGAELARPCWYDQCGRCLSHWDHRRPCPVEALDAALANFEGGA